MNDNVQEDCAERVHVEPAAALFGKGLLRQWREDSLEKTFLRRFLTAQMGRLL